MITIENIKFKNLSEVAYGHKTISYDESKKGKIATIEYTFEDKTNKIHGFIEVTMDEHIENVKNIGDFIKDKLIKSFRDC
jgi:hypothetical protein